MNLSCPELALHLLADLLWLRHMAHELSHPCPPPSSSSQGEKNDNGKLSAANLLSVSSEVCDPLAVPGWPLPAPWLRLPVQGHQPRCWDPSARMDQVLGSLWQPTAGALSTSIAAALGSLAELEGFAVLTSYSYPKQLLHLSPDASFQRQMLWFLYTFAFSARQALKCLSSWSILNDNMHLYSLSFSNEWGSS